MSRPTKTWTAAQVREDADFIHRRARKFRLARAVTAPALAVCNRLAQQLRRLHEGLLEKTPNGGLVVDELSLEDCLRFNNALVRLEATLRSKLDELRLPHSENLNRKGS